MAGLSLLLFLVFAGAVAIFLKELETDERDRLLLANCCDEVSVVPSQLLVGVVSEFAAMVTFGGGKLGFRLTQKSLISEGDGKTVGASFDGEACISCVDVSLCTRGNFVGLEILLATLPIEGVEGVSLTLLGKAAGFCEYKWVFGCIELVGEPACMVEGTDVECGRFTGHTGGGNGGLPFGETESVSANVSICLSTALQRSSVFLLLII